MGEHDLPDDDPAEDVTAIVAGPDFARRRLRARLRRWRPFLIAGFAVLMVLIVLWLVFVSSVVTARRVEISGNTTVGTSRIERAAAVPLNRQLIRIDLAAIQARVEAIPAVRSASVSRSWPHAIRIEVVERTPVAVVQRGSTLQSVDVDGVLFGSYNHAPADLPLIRTPADVQSSALAEAAQVVTSLQPGIAAKVEHLDVETVDRITLSLTGGVTVVWGSADDSEHKAEVLAVLLQRAGKDVSTIDVSVPGRPTTR